MALFMVPLAVMILFWQLPPQAEAADSLDGEDESSGSQNGSDSSGAVKKANPLTYIAPDPPSSPAPGAVPQASSSPAAMSLSPGSSARTGVPSSQPPLSGGNAALAQSQTLTPSPPGPLDGTTYKTRGVSSITGTVNIRRPFKLFARQQLIHNLSFRETPVREVIAEIARQGNLNIIIDKSVTGKITGELRDVTLNEAMDSVLAAAGLQSRTLDNSTVIVGTLQAMVQLGLNRPVARAFKLSYAHPYDVAMILHASIFNRGLIPDFALALRRKGITDAETSSEFAPEGPRLKETEKTTDDIQNDQTSRPDVARTIRGSSRSQTQEGVGFNNAATDPGAQQIRASQEISADYIVEQNGGNAIVIPDVKNRQVIVVGTVEDMSVAEESIRLLDRRPRQVHVQASLIELNNQGIRQFGVIINTQGQGASASLLGNSQAPLVQFLPGMGSPGNTVTGNGSGVTSQTQLTSAGAIPFATTNTVTANSQFNQFKGPQSNVTTFAPGNPFSGLVGAVLPVAAQTIAGVTSVAQASSGFNFLTLSGAGGGKTNIATIPTALNVNLQLLLQSNKAKLIANPSVVISDNTESLITIANEVVHKVTSTVSLGVVTTNVELAKAGIFLNCLPKISEDGFVTMRLRPQVSTPLGAPLVFGNAATSPTIVTLLSIRDIMSQEVRIKDGQTLVIGGLFTEQEASQMAKVPYFAETPVLGALFRNTLKGRNRTELMLLITPKIVEEEAPSASLSESPARTM